jgi:hypothetical protein
MVHKKPKKIATFVKNNKALHRDAYTAQKTFHFKWKENWNSAKTDVKTTSEDYKILRITLWQIHR